MHHVQLSYALTPPDAGAASGGGIRNPLMDLLQAVREEGSISAAAARLALSYRHVWGELKRWEARLGQPLIIWEKGQPARLTPLADKLLWAERQAQARLAPQIESLQSNLERTFAIAFDPEAHVLTLFASHDDALPALREFAATQARLHLDIRFAGSVDAIRALNEGRCVMAGFHTPPSPAAGTLAQRAYQPLLKPGLHKIIGFAQRTQGLLVARGNPLGLTRLADLQRPGLRFVNRPIGSGTRVLTEQLLAEAGIQPHSLQGWDREEPSHAAVATAVASGSADAGIAIESIAAASGLGFVPLVTEDYWLVCLRAALEQPPMAALRRVLASPAWQDRVCLLAGYRPHHSGEVLSLSGQLPWWRFSKRARPPVSG